MLGFILLYGSRSNFKHISLADVFVESECFEGTNKPEGSASTHQSLEVSRPPAAPWQLPGVAERIGARRAHPGFEGGAGCVPGTFEGDRLGLEMGLRCLGG